MTDKQTHRNQSLETNTDSHVHTIAFPATIKLQRTRVKYSDTYFVLCFVSFDLFRDYFCFLFGGGRAGCLVMIYFHAGNMLVLRNTITLLGTILSAVLAICPPGFRQHTPGFWQNSVPGPPGDPKPPLDHHNNTPALCGAKCLSWHPTCAAFELNVPPGGNRSAAVCYVFPSPLQLPFQQYSVGNITTCVVDGYVPPTPQPPPQRGRTHGHTFPRLGNCWGNDPYIGPSQYDYHGFHNITNATW